MTLTYDIQPAHKAPLVTLALHGDRDIAGLLLDMRATGVCRTGDTASCIIHPDNVQRFLGDIERQTGKRFQPRIAGCPRR